MNINLKLVIRIYVNNLNLNNYLYKKTFLPLVECSNAKQRSKVAVSFKIFLGYISNESVSFNHFIFVHIFKELSVFHKNLLTYGQAKFFLGEVVSYSIAQ